MYPVRWGSARGSLPRRSVAKGALTSESIPSTRGVSLRYPGSDADLDDVSAKVHAGGSVVLAGESGSSKATLVYTLLGFLVPSAGEALLDGEVIRASSKSSVRALRHSA